MTRFAVTPSDVTAAADRLAPFVRCTPLLSAPGLDAAAGRRIFVKAEALQHTGSFKYRGAKNAVLARQADGAAGVVAVSSGNHGQGVARAAADSGLPAVILMPSDAPAAKIDGTRACGAEVVLYDRRTADRDALGAEMAQDRGYSLILPFDDPDVIAGQGSCGVEMAGQLDRAGMHAGDVVVCCGGGGLSAGIALALSARAPGLRVRTAEPDGFDDMARSLSSGRYLANAPGRHSLCDAILTPQPGQLTFPILQHHAGPGMCVDDRACLRAMALAFRHLRLVLEPGGAVALAAALSERSTDRPVAVVATGGNVDAQVFRRALDTLD